MKRLYDTAWKRLVGSSVTVLASQNQDSIEPLKATSFRRKPESKSDSEDWILASASMTVGRPGHLGVWGKLLFLSLQATEDTRVVESAAISLSLSTNELRLPQPAAAGGPPVEVYH